ncbi:hypothetical protein [Marilutibacter alkalisoli]|uniref:Uncharacterized protein n=1 Tax=Marilutibacter alkalisoli TaxID=2591633 RepID=A0A514BSI4_9GAMM|nr:hypothetical protein [Lysobacter alkalisoli]QDH70353.1 hypothetical protein FKV23_09810 [Lysobacter alkalisoli]
MSEYPKPFDWQQFPEGRARFSGSVRGADERGHETFAVELRGETYYGEVRRTFLQNENDFNIEIVSFGWPGTEWVGMPMPGMCHTFSPEESDEAKKLIVGMIQAAAASETRPGLLNEYADARFMGQVVFREGWALLEAGESST